MSKSKRLKILKKAIRVKGEGMNEGAPQNCTLGLFDLVEDIKKHLGEDITIVEVGCFAGVSTEIFALNFSNVVAIDAWEKVFEIGYTAIPRENLIAAEKEFDKVQKRNPNIQKIIGYSDLTAMDFEFQTVDCVYIDASHEYQQVKNDIEAWLPRIKNGGIMAGHDFDNIFAVRQAVMDTIGKPDAFYDDCSWLKYL